MKIVYEAEMSIPYLKKIISTLTNRGRVCVDEIKFDSETASVTLIFSRRTITSFKKSIFRGEKAVYGENYLRSSLIIRQVEDYSIQVDDKLKTHCDSCFTMLFGAKIDDTELHIESVEEIQGDPLCQISIKYKKTSIELTDEFNNNA